MPRTSLLTSRASIGSFRKIATAVANFNFAPTIDTNVQNYNLNSAAIANGWDGVTAITANVLVNSNVYVWSDSTATAAFVVGTLPAGSVVNITNNGFIMGRGGDGASMTGANQGTRYGTNGGPAIDINYNITITNNSYIAGGGGGGDGWGQGSDAAGGGGGAGGGTGGSGWTVTGSVTAPGSAGGTVGNTATSSSGVGAAWGGGRILPGSDNNQAGGRGGGTLRSAGPNLTNRIGGGGGGGWGAKGGAAFSIGPISGVLGYVYGLGGLTNQSGGNGAWPVGSGSAGSGSSTGGKAITLNGYTATFAVTGTVYGAVS